MSAREPEAGNAKNQNGRKVHFETFGNGVRFGEAAPTHFQ